jgi:hypothetical protein
MLNMYFSVQTAHGGYTAGGIDYNSINLKIGGF